MSRTIHAAPSESTRRSIFAASSDVAHAAADAAAIQRDVCAGKIFHAHAAAAEDHREIRRDAARQAHVEPCVREARRESRGTDAIEQIHGRHVERKAQRFGRADRAVVGHVEIAGPVGAERLRRVDEQRFRNRSGHRRARVRRGTASASSPASATHAPCRRGRGAPDRRTRPSRRTRALRASRCRRRAARPTCARAGARGSRRRALRARAGARHRSSS